MQTTDTILMVRPASFGFNTETATTNFFQQPITGLSIQQIQQMVLGEFDNMVETLTTHGIEVIVAEDSPDPAKPDAVFPNNWLCTNPDGIVSVFPLHAHNRRAEKRDDILGWLTQNYVIRDLHDWSEFEPDGLFLEGTGSMVMDHENRIIYAALSERTHISLLEKFAAAHEYTAMAFHAADKNNQPIYHTNVMMSVGETIAVLCEEAIADELELIAVTQLLQSTDHYIVNITKDQLESFAGNMLEIRNKTDDNFLVMSQTAYDSLTNDQFEQLQTFTIPLPINVKTIETIGGGSVRCMMTEIFLEKKI